jgi:16S rRNA (adenine1518-N6/adenine1519-N6)-dimethyltransferase
MDFKYKKSLGQNFIYDIGFLRSVVAELDIKPTDTVLEIGAGAGTLTKVLAQCKPRIRTVEIDERLRPVLERELSGVEIVFGDVMKLDFDDLPPFRLVANVPYYITTPILMKFLTHQNCTDINILVAADVAARIIAEPSTPEYGALSVVCQVCGECRIIKAVGKEMFTPRPKIDSAFVRIIKHDAANIDHVKFARLLKGVFSARRKTVQNSLSAALCVSKETANRILSCCGISPNVRAEELEPAKFTELLQKSSNYNK